MPSPAVLVVLSFTFRALPVLSLAHPGPKPTDLTSDLPNSVGWSPKPTTEPIVNAPFDLHRRASYAPINTCGWFYGNAADPYACANGNACSANLVGAYFGCCQTDAGGNYVTSDCAYIATGYTNCYDYTAASLCTGICYDENRVCDSSYPYCGKATMSVGAEVLTNYDCYDSIYVRALDIETTVLYTSSLGASTPAASLSISSSVAVKSNILSTGPDSVSSTGSPVTTINTSVSSSISPAPTNTESPNPPTSHAGAIAGGVVGGLAGLAMVVGGAIFWLHKRKQREMKAMAPEISQTM